MERARRVRDAQLRGSLKSTGSGVLPVRRMSSSGAGCAGTVVKSLLVPARWMRLLIWPSRPRLGMPAGVLEAGVFLARWPIVLGECQTLVAGIAMDSGSLGTKPLRVPSGTLLEPCAP
eukprot:2414235-Amphidinium_carterae.2